MSTWVFLRGLTREARHWGNFPAKFRAEIPDADIVTPDLPGNGQLNHLASPIQVREMVEYCREQLSRRSVAPPYHLLGISLGAMVAVDWASRHPRELLPCVLINTSLRPFSPFYQRLKPRNYLRLLGLATRGGDAEKIERGVFRMTSTLEKSPAGVIENWISYRKQFPVTRANALRQLLAAARYRAPITRPAVPLLILAAARDGLVSPQCSQRLASLWDAKLAVHPEAGHDLPLDDGVWVARQAREWLA